MRTSAIRARPGLTLLEVVIALAIFLFSLVAITQLLTLSGERALLANLRAHAALLCQSKLAEVVSGVQPLQSAGYAAFTDDPDWQWRMECNEGDVPGLWNVQVWVKKDRPDGSAVEVTLSQMVLSPSKRGSVLDPPATPAQGATP